MTLNNEIMLTVEPVQPDIHGAQASSSAPTASHKQQRQKGKSHAAHLFANISLVELFEDSVILDMALKYVLELSTNNV